MSFFELIITTNKIVKLDSYPPASKASREVANFTKKNPPAHVFGAKILSCCLSVLKFDLNYLMISRTKWAEIFLGGTRQKSHVVFVFIWSGHF